MKKIIILLLTLFPILVNAQESLNEYCIIKINEEEFNALSDNKYTTYVSADKEEKLIIECEKEFKNIYIMYNIKSSEGILTYNNKNINIGTNKYLNEIIKLSSSTKSVSIAYNEKYSIADIYLFDENIPSWVQDWQSLDKADLMLFSTHADDEQLFFAGLMPTYINKGYKIQVIYFTNHYNNTFRYQEQLDGLWIIGIKYYPVISTFPDAFSSDLNGAIKNLNSAGFTRDDALLFEVNQIRKFRPYVVVGHDEKGEYSHGQHILNTDVLKEAIIIANDTDYKTDYEPWQINKLYLHLYQDKQISLNYDIPLKSYNGKTAYEVSKEGYAKHYSQQYTWFTEWLNGPNNSFTHASQIKTYNPMLYGLYYTNVGDDIKKDDMFENIKFPISEILFNDNTDNSFEKFINTYKGLNINEKYFYIGLSIILISGVGIGLLKKQKRK